jgi:late competence protein required for DNA uptake (superfamily II DNA/RNA helicase)
VKDKIKFMDCIRWWTVKEKFKCVRCGAEHEQGRAIRKGKDFICMDCITGEGIYAVARTI